MSAYYLTYPLHQGYIHNWLVAGPAAQPVEEPDQFAADDFKPQVAQHYYQAEHEIQDQPVHWQTIAVGKTELPWQHQHCLEDHFVNLSGFYHTPHYLRSFAYTELISPLAQTVNIVLTSNGPADLWVNGDHIHRQAHFQHQLPGRVSLAIPLQAGPNRLLVRFEAVAMRECPYLLALQLLDFAGQAEKPVRLAIGLDEVALYQQLETMFSQGYLDRDTFIHEDNITLNWPLDLADKTQYAVQIQARNNRIYGQREAYLKDGKKLKLMTTYELPDNVYDLVIRPSMNAYYQQGIRVERRISLNTVRKGYSSQPYGSNPERRLEALRTIAMMNQGLYSEIARMAGGWWTNLRPDLILEAIEQINQRADCSDFYLVGLLGMLYRFSEHESFPPEVLEPLTDCILNFRYWLDEPGEDAMCFWSENHQILFHSCEILAGQRFPDQVFPNSGLTGQQHREKGERLALAWLNKRAQHGFQEWDSNCYFEHDLLALSHLLDLAETQPVWEMAAVMIDKMLLTIALNSFQGVFGSTHGRSYTPYIKGGYLEATSGISRLMWGQGTFNRHILGTVSMACCENYELPAIIAAIALDQPETGTWSKERHAGQFDPAVDLKSGAWEVNKVTYKTADYMLCSAQDYQPGQPGYQQHIWQATLGPEAVVFVNHPACLSEEGVHRPGCWHGNVVLPRVAQWKDVLIAIHNLPEDDWLGFTHAYFPRYAFDQRVTLDGWAFARQGDGYIALTASTGLELIRRGQNAYRELRSYGRQTVWLCQMGRRAEDGSFEEFRQKVAAQPLTFAGLSVDYTSPRGDTIRFGWETPFYINDQAQDLHGFKHYDGPYAAADWPASVLAMGYGKQLVRLRMAD